MAYNELIKNFERVRAYMREFYVYGFKSRNEYDAKSARSYDSEIKKTLKELVEEIDELLASALTFDESTLCLLCLMQCGSIAMSALIIWGNIRTRSKQFACFPLKFT